MSIEMMIYLIGVVGDFAKMMGVVFIVAGVLSGACWLFYAMNWIDGEAEGLQAVRQLAKTSLVIFASIGVVGPFVPSERTLTLMVAASLGKEAIASETGQKLKKVLDSKLDQLVAEIEKKAK